MKNYYDILEIKENASHEIIKAAYKVLAKKYHPDNWKGKEEFANEKFSEIRKAYEVLSNETLRREYNTQLELNRYSNSHMCKNNKNTASDDTSDSNEQETDIYRRSGFLKGVLKMAGNSILDLWGKSQHIFHEAYLDGLEMPEALLVSCCRKTTGVQKIGYIKAMEERGFFERNPEGRLIATDKLRKYLL